MMKNRDWHNVFPDIFGWKKRGQVPLESGVTSPHFF